MWCYNHGTIWSVCMTLTVSLSISISESPLYASADQTKIILGYMTTFLSPFLYLFCLSVLVISLCVIIFFTGWSHLTALICLCLPRLLWSNREITIKCRACLYSVRQKKLRNKRRQEGIDWDKCTLFRYSFKLRHFNRYYEPQLGSFVGDHCSIQLNSPTNCNLNSSPSLNHL